MRNFLNPMAEKGRIIESDIVKGRWEIMPEGEALMDIFLGLQ